MNTIENIKVFACGEIPNSVIEEQASVTKQFENYLKVINNSLFKYYIKGSLNKIDCLVKNISFYENYEKSNLKELEKTLDNLDLVIILGDLKDKHSVNNIELISKVAREKGILVIAMVLIPYYTDRNKQLKYEIKVECLSNRVDSFIRLEAEEIALSSNRSLVTKDGIKLSASYMLSCLEHVMEFFTIEGALKIEKKDFNEILKNSGLGCISIGHGTGEDKFEKALKRVLANNRKIIKCNKFLIGISGDKDMELSCIENILDRIQDIVGDDANIIFQVIIDEKLNDDLIITIIGTYGGYNENSSINFLK